MQCWQILTSGRCVRPSRRDSLRPRVASTFGECLPIMSFNFTFHGLKYAGTGRNKFRLYTSVTKWIFLYFLLYHPQLIQVFAIYSSWQSFDLILYSYPITVKPMFSFLSPFGQKKHVRTWLCKEHCKLWRLKTFPRSGTREWVEETLSSCVKLGQRVYTRILEISKIPRVFALS